MPELPPIHRWEVERPRALVHVVHGMAEYGARYGRLAAALNRAGYAVWAHDHRGHGEWLQPGVLRGHFADAGGWRLLLDDASAVSGALQASTPAAPLLLFAHSMGSFVAQALIAERGHAYRGVVLCGTNGAAGMAEAGARTVARIERLAKGGRSPATFVQDLVFRTYNRQFAPVRTRADWLSRDAREVDAYLADTRRCGFTLTTQAWCDFLDARRDLGIPSHLARIPGTLPIRIIAGGSDPVGENGTGVQRLHDACVAAQLRVSRQAYDSARHELVNETNRGVITSDLLDWLDGVVAGP